MSKARPTWVLAVVITGLASGPADVSAQTSSWQAQHDDGWKAFQQGRLSDAETLLKAAAKSARSFGPQDPRMATTLDHLAWVFCARGKYSDAESFANWALQS